jgi:hypothetical protein
LIDVDHDRLSDANVIGIDVAESGESAKQTAFLKRLALGAARFGRATS